MSKQPATAASAVNPNAPDDDLEANPVGNRIEQLELSVAAEIQAAKDDLEKFTKYDKSYRRKDTVEVVVNAMKRIMDAAAQINKESEDVRERLYYLIYNSTILIFKACHQLRESNFSREATKFLAFNLLCLDNTLILTTTKYLDWRVLNYVELARAYSDFGAYKAATKVISYGISKVLYSKQVEEQDPPVPEGTKDTLIDALRVLRTQELKYELQSGALSPEAWKKKLEDTFQTNKYHRSLAIVECLQTNEPFATSIRGRETKLAHIKSDAIKLVLEMVKPDVELVKQALVQVHEKKKRDREKKEKIQNRDPEVDLDELLDKYKQMDAEMIPEKDWKFASQCVPIEIHVEIVKLAYECQLWPEFEALLDPALVRLKFRRYEVPYLATIDVMMSANKIANIPNGFEKLPKDLNQANLRIELKRLRAQAKKSKPGDKGGDDGKREESKKPAQQQEKKKEEKKKDGKDKDKAHAEDDSKQNQTDEIQATETELEAIKHIYVHMLLQRTKNPQNAIVGVDVVLADENLGPDLPDNHYAVAVPIRQHAGSYEKQGVIPYVVFRRTANSLIDEEDSLSIITDICVIQGQDPHLRAPLGYHKIPIDLRQTPKELERVPNLDYVYICYRTDKQLAIAERDLLILRRLVELEKSFVSPSSEAHKQMDEAKKFLGISYNLDLLIDLSGTVKEALLGPLGDSYLEYRLDLLSETSSLLWMRYLVPVLKKIDIYTEMRGQKEYYGEFIDTIDESVIKVKHDFVETLNVIHRILTRQEFITDMVMYCKCAIFLSNLQEEIGEFRNAVQTLRSSLGKVVEYREERMKQSLDGNAEDNATTSMSITIDNKKIGDLELKMRTIYSTWEELILRKERDRVRKEHGATALDEDEGDEEQLEVKKCIEELRNKDLFERGIDVPQWQVENRDRNSLAGKKFFEETDQIVHALHLDILMNLYRCEIKLGREMGVVKKQTQDLLKTQGIDLAKNAPGNLTKNLSGKLNQKMNLSKGKTLSQNKGALKSLQQTLQEAGKMPPAKPQILSFEKILERENNQNPYQNSLLYMALAMAKTNTVEQKSLLLESMEFLKKAKTGEETLANLALDNAVYIRAARYYHEYFAKTPDKIHPMSLLAKPIYIKKTPVPQKPVMICRTSTSITMKLPFYKPLTEYKAWRNIDSVALYGKPSGSGVAVSLNNTDYDGTGEKRKPGAVVNVTGLIPNERYVFAAGGYTPDSVCVNGIGETSNEILTLLPLSLHQLYGYLAEIAFKLGHYQIAKQASEVLCHQFLIKNEFNYPHLNTTSNPILAYRLDMDYINRISMIEVKQLAEAFIILARVSKLVRGEVQRRADTHELQIEKQKIDMKIANFLTLALEISTFLNRPTLTKRVVAEIFNHLTPYFSMKMRPQILLQVLLKCHQSLRLVPCELVDANCRKMLGCLSYQVVKLGFETCEDKALRRAMISELPIQSRKWRKYSQYVIQRPQLTDEEKEKQEEQTKRIELGEEIPEEELVKDPEPYEERLIKLDEFEDEGSALEEFLLSLIDYQDIVKAKNEKWKEQVDKMIEDVSGGEETITALKETTVNKLEFWEQVKLNKPSAQLQALITAQEGGQANSRYLEFCCKCIRRALEIGDFASFEEMGSKIKEGVKIPEEDEALIESRVNERLEHLNKDVVRKQRKRFATLEEKVKQMLEQQTLSGGNATFSTKKLQQLVSGDKILNDDDESQFVVQFDTKDIEELKLYSFLWISEKFFLEGICLFLEFGSLSQQRSQLQVATQSCVFNDILQINFIEYKSTLEEFQDAQRIKKEQFEEDHKEDNEEYVVDQEDRVVKITSILKVMARAAEYAKHSRSWLQLISIIKYTWNVFSYDLTNPLELTQGEGWHYILLIAECSLYLVEHLKKGGSLRKMAGRDIDQVPGQKPSFDKDINSKSVAFKFDEGAQVVDGGAQADGPGTEKPAQPEPKANKGEKWFEAIDEFSISLHASLIGFTVQCLMAVSKWESLVDISNRLNNATNNEFASQLLPFIIYAQSTLHSEAATQTSEKRKALEVRVQQFENWKLTSKKKRSRQAMLTGEIPIEEQEFNRDKQQLEKEIFRLDVIENVLLSDKRASEGLLENIKRDANNCVENLKQCRKLYHKFGIETQNLQQEEKKKGKNHFEIKSKRKGHKVFTTMIIGNYKKCIELLRKRQEKFLLIQALHELGNLLYADGNLVEAEICWNDCVDTIFQRLYVINQFRDVFAENPSLADSFGSRQVLIGGIVLTKLAKLCYEGIDMHKYSECILMASDLLTSPAQLSLPHPQVASEYAHYNFREFMGRDLFTDSYILQPSELIHSLSVASQALIDITSFQKALPLTSLMEFLSQEVARSKVLTVKARLLKAIALVELGFIDEALQVYKRVIKRIDLPNHAQRDSEFSKKLEGKNFHFAGEHIYRNDLVPEAEENQATLKFLMDPVPEETEKKLQEFCTPYIVESLQFLRSIFLVKIGEIENVESLEKSELRYNLLKTAEDSLRASLKRIQLAEEVAVLRSDISDLATKEVDQEEAKLEAKQAELASTFEKGGVAANLQTTFYENSEEEMCFADQRSQRLSLILRIRYTISRIYLSQGQLIEGFYTLRQGLYNFKSLAEGQYKDIEKGTEAENKGSFKLPDSISSANPAGGAQKAGGAKQDKKDPKKGAAAEETEVKKEEVDEASIEKARKVKEEVEARDRRAHPHIQLWLGTKLKIINILLAQKRYEDCADAIAVTRLEASSVKDQLYLRRLLEMEFLIHVQSGDMKEAHRMASDIRKHAKKHFQRDSYFCEFLGNYSEVLYNENKNPDALETIEEARRYSRDRMLMYGVVIDQQDINSHGDVKIWEDRKQATEEELEAALANAPQAAAGGGGTKPPAGGQQKQGGKPPVPGGKPSAEDDETTEASSLDFSKPVEYKLKTATKEVNSSSNPLNLYIFGLEAIVRFDLRYAQYLTLIQQKHDEAKTILLEAQKILERTLYISPQLKFYLAFLLGHVNREIFYERVKQFQAGYMRDDAKYKNSFTRHVPHGSIALGHFLLELPNFSQRLQEEYRSNIEASEKAFIEAIEIGKKEAVVYEFDFSCVDALRGMAEICFLKAEYRSRSLSYKYAKFDEEDVQRRLERLRTKKLDELREAGENDELDDGLLQKELGDLGDKWEEQKHDKEALEVFNYRVKSLKFLESVVTACTARADFNDKQHEIGAATLTDVSKIPRAVVSELFEASQVSKVMTSKHKDYEFKDKTSISSGELLAYMKAVVNECCMLTFGFEKARLSKLISKLHRYLAGNLPPYQQRCSLVVPEPEILTEAPEIEKKQIAPTGQVVSHWFDFESHNSSMFYILGPQDESIVPAQPEQEEGAPEPTEEERQKRAEEHLENITVHFGKVEVPALELSKLYQDTRDLIDKMKASEELSAEKNERDRKYYKQTFHSLIERLGNFFKPPVTTEEEQERDVDCLNLVKDLIPELSIESVERLATIMTKDAGCSWSDPLMNGIMRRFHRVRFIK